MMTFKELSEQYLNSIEFSQLEHNSQRNYKSKINSIRRFEATTGKEYYDCINSLEVSNNTKNTYIAVIKSIYKWARFQGIGGDREDLGRSLATTKFRVTPRDPNGYTLNEIKKIRKAAKGNYEIYSNFLTALFYTGCRPSELYDLKWEDVDFDKRLISIRGSKRREKGTVSRYCSIIKEIKDCLLVAKWFNNPEKPSDLVFRGVRGKRLCPQYTRTAVKKLAQRASVSLKRELRSARSGLATTMHKKGYDLVAIQSQLGHKSLNTTLKYVQLDMKQKARLFKGF